MSTKQSLSRLQRLHKLLGREDLARRLGVSERSISSWEAGENVPGGPAQLLMAALEAWEKSVTSVPTGADWKDLRAKGGWTQQQLAELLGTTSRRVSGWEADETTPVRATWRMAQLILALKPVFNA